MALVKHWTAFPGRPHSHFTTAFARVTLGPRGVIYLNEKAWIALRRPEAIEMMFDKGLRMIGIKKTNPLEPTTFPVKHKSGARPGRVISASSFCTHFLIKTMRTGQFNAIDIDDEGLTPSPPSPAAPGEE